MGSYFFCYFVIVAGRHLDSSHLCTVRSGRCPKDAQRQNLHLQDLTGIAEFEVLPFRRGHIMARAAQDVQDVSCVQPLGGYRSLRTMMTM